jgi:hypothetical protein
MSVSKRRRCCEIAISCKEALVIWLAVTAGILLLFLASAARIYFHDPRDLGSVSTHWLSERAADPNPDILESWPDNRKPQ